MNRIIRRTLAPVALLSLALLAAAPVAAAAPEGVVFDATVTVVVRESGGGPLPNATVDLVAYQNDFPDDSGIPPLKETTDESGTAVFHGVARSDGSGAPVYLAVFAQTYSESLGPDLCLTTKGLAGEVADLASPVELVEIEAFGTSSLVCRRLTGRFVDAAGNPVPGDFELSRISVALADGPAWSFPLFVDDDGLFEQNLPPFGSHEDPALVELVFVSEPRERVDIGGGCERITAETATWQELLALGSDDPPGPMEIITAPVVGERCGSVSQPDSGAPGGATPTLPPTDTLRAVSGAGTSGAGEPFPASGVLLAVGLLLLGSAQAVRVTRRPH